MCHFSDVIEIVKFQSTLPRRERHGTNTSQPATMRFQSTLPRRERQQFQPKIHSNFQQKSTNYHFIYLIFPFSHPLFFLHSTSFVHILECESPGIFMSASYSHSYIITKSMYHLLQFRDRHPYVPPLSDTYFPDNRTSGCQRSHQ